MVAAFALLGGILAAKAHDDEMLVFGLGLVVFGVCFIAERVWLHRGRKRALAVASVGHNRG